MGLRDNIINQYDVSVTSLADRPRITANELKAVFDARTNDEVKESINGIINELTDNGASQIGFTPYSDIEETNIQDAVERLSDITLRIGDLPSIGQPHIIADNGERMTARAILDFKSGFELTDNPAAESTEIRVDFPTSIDANNVVENVDRQFVSGAQKEQLPFYFKNVAVSTTDFTDLVDETTYGTYTGLQLKDFGFNKLVEVYVSDIITVDYSPNIIFNLQEVESNNYSSIALVLTAGHIAFFAKETPENDFTIPLVKLVQIDNLTPGTNYFFYDGEYFATPKTIEIVLETENTILTDNITINPIPYYEFSNQNGTTVTIGGEF